MNECQTFINPTEICGTTGLVACIGIVIAEACNDGSYNYHIAHIPPLAAKNSLTVSYVWSQFQGILKKIKNPHRCEVFLGGGRNPEVGNSDGTRDLSQFKGDITGALQKQGFPTPMTHRNAPTKLNSDNQPLPLMDMIVDPKTKKIRFTNRKLGSDTIEGEKIEDITIASGPLREKLSLEQKTQEFISHQGFLLLIEQAYQQVTHSDGIRKLPDSLFATLLESGQVPDRLVQEYYQKTLESAKKLDPGAINILPIFLKTGILTKKQLVQCWNYLKKDANNPGADTTIIGVGCLAELRAIGGLEDPGGQKQVWDIIKDEIKKDVFFTFAEIKQIIENNQLDTVKILELFALLGNKCRENFFVDAEQTIVLASCMKQLKQLGQYKDPKIKDTITILRNLFTSGHAIKQSSLQPHLPFLSELLTSGVIDKDKIKIFWDTLVENSSDKNKMLYILSHMNQNIFNSLEKNEIIGYYDEIIAKIDLGVAGNMLADKKILLQLLQTDALQSDQEFIQKQRQKVSTNSALRCCIPALAASGYISKEQMQAVWANRKIINNRPVDYDEALGYLIPVFVEHQVIGAKDIRALRDPIILHGDFTFHTGLLLILINTHMIHDDIGLAKVRATAKQRATDEEASQEQHKKKFLLSLLATGYFSIGSPVQDIPLTLDTQLGKLVTKIFEIQKNPINLNPHPPLSPPLSPPIAITADLIQQLEQQWIDPVIIGYLYAKALPVIPSPPMPESNGFGDKKVVTALDHRKVWELDIINGSAINTDHISPENLPFLKKIGYIHAYITCLVGEDNLVKMLEYGKTRSNKSFEDIRDTMIVKNPRYRLEDSPRTEIRIQIAYILACALENPAVLKIRIPPFASIHVDRLQHCANSLKEIKNSAQTFTKPIVTIPIQAKRGSEEKFEPQMDDDLLIEQAETLFKEPDDYEDTEDNQSTKFEVVNKATTNCFMLTFDYSGGDGSFQLKYPGLNPFLNIESFQSYLKGAPLFLAENHKIFPILQGCKGKEKKLAGLKKDPTQQENRNKISDLEEEMIGLFANINLLLQNDEQINNKGQSLMNYFLQTYCAMFQGKSVLQMLCSNDSNNITTLAMASYETIIDDIFTNTGNLNNDNLYDMKNRLILEYIEVQANKNPDTPQAKLRQIYKKLRHDYHNHKQEQEASKDEVKYNLHIGEKTFVDLASVIRMGSCLGNRISDLKQENAVMARLENQDGEIDATIILQYDPGTSSLMIFNLEPSANVIKRHTPEQIEKIVYDIVEGLREYASINDLELHAHTESHREGSFSNKTEVTIAFKKLYGPFTPEYNHINEVLPTIYKPPLTLSSYSFLQGNKIRQANNIPKG